MGKTNLGRVAFVPRGAYDNEVAYKRLDVVEYEGSSYLFFKDSMGIVPIGDGEVTMLLAKRGKDFTYDDFTLEQLEVLKGADGKDGADGMKGDKGDTGKGLTILGYYGTLDLLKAAVAIPEPGDVYGVGEAAPYDIYVFDSVTNDWVSNGNFSEGPITVKLGEIPYPSIDGTVSLPAYPTVPTNYVTTNTEQNINGKKIFSNDITINRVNAYTRYEGSNGKWWTGVGVKDGDGMFAIYNAYNGRHAITIGQSDNMGINTGLESPTSTLDVNGQIRMRRPPVDAFPDFIMATNRNDYGYAEWMSRKRFPEAINDITTMRADLIGLDENTYYPVLFQLSAGFYSRIRVQNALDGMSVPSWSTDSAGFSLCLEYTSMGYGWGTIPYNPCCLHYNASFFNGKSPFGGRRQYTNFSNEVIWLRGGGNYNIFTDSNTSGFINPRGAITIGDDPYKFTIPTRTYEEATDDMLVNFSVSTAGENIFATGAIACPSTSDLRLKEIHERLCFSDKLMELGSVEQYNYTEAERKRKAENGTPDDVLNHYGFIYQNIKGTDLDHITYERENGYGAVNYLSPDLLSLIAGAVQENIEAIRKLKKANQELRNLSLWKLSINSLTRKLYAISNQVVKLLRLKER